MISMMGHIERLALSKPLGVLLIFVGAGFGAMTGVMAMVFVFDATEDPNLDRRVEEARRDVRICEITDGCNVTKAEERAAQELRRHARENDEEWGRAVQAGWAAFGNASLVGSGVLLVWYVDRRAGGADQ